jgi:4-hydroxy-tetrahydrodipicolinate reductase
MTLKIAIAGIAGRMGRALIQTAPHAGVVIVGGTERAGAPQIGLPIEGSEAVARGALIEADVALAAKAAEVWVDFSPPQACLASLNQLAQTGVKAAVIGTTGFTPEQDTAIAQHATRIAIVKAGNFSLGMNLLMGLVEQAAARLGPDWDIEILEAHHRMKVDAPSGAALMLGEAAAAGRGVQLADVRARPYDGIQGSRPDGTIGFASIRAGGIIGDHEVRFGSTEEVLVLGHRALDRTIFAKGALHAARWAAGREPGLYSMRDVLDL